MHGPPDQTLEEELARSRSELRTLLSHTPPFSSISPEALNDLVNECEIIAVPGGARLSRAGHPLDAMIGVLHGALRVVRPTSDGMQTVREFYRGDTLGVLGLLGRRPYPVELFAVRDSTLTRLPRTRFLALAERHPALLEALAELVSERAFGALEALAGAPAPTAAHGGTLAILPLSPSVREVTDQLIARVAVERGITHVTRAFVDEALGAGAAESDGDSGVTAWLSELERNAAELIVYECDARLRQWTARCLRQSDRLIVVAAAGDALRSGAALAALTGSEDGLPRPIDLVLVHPDGTARPTGTAAWSRAVELRGCHHVRKGSLEDASRAARRLVGTPTGVVLSGGGARGIAHVGVLAAIREAGIPIDYVCGTSMGAIFAAGLALGFDIPRMREEVRELFGRPFALYDPTLPISSLLAGKKLNRVLQHQLGDGDIEDLWTPFFCVSTDLSHARMVVHERGRLWKAVRASCAIPGIFPPLPLDGCMLVDGGLVDNLPLDLLAERCPGPIIAVDVFPYGDPGFEKPRGRIAGVLRALRTRVKGEPASPPLFDVLMRSTLVGSKVRQGALADRAAPILRLEPPVQSFGTLEWRAHRELFEVGYRHALAELARHRAGFPHG